MTSSITQSTMQTTKREEKKKNAQLILCVCTVPIPSVLDPDPDWIRIQSGQWIRIRNPDPEPGGQKRSTKVEKIKKFHVLKSFMEAKE